MYLLFPQKANDILAEGTEPDRLAGQFRVFFGQSRHIPNKGVCVKSEDQVRACKVGKKQPMGLDDLAHMHELPEHAGRPGGVAPTTASQAFAAAR